MFIFLVLFAEIRTLFYNSPPFYPTYYYVSAKRPNKKSNCLRLNKTDSMGAICLSSQLLKKKGQNLRKNKMKD